MIESEKDAKEALIESFAIFAENVSAKMTDADDQPLKKTFALTVEQIQDRSVEGLDWR